MYLDVVAALDPTVDVRPGAARGTREPRRRRRRGRRGGAHLGRGARPASRSRARPLRSPSRRRRCSTRAPAGSSSDHPTASTSGRASTCSPARSRRGCADKGASRAPSGAGGHVPCRREWGLSPASQAAARAARARSTSSTRTRSASAASRSRRIAWTFPPAVSRWTLASSQPPLHRPLDLAQALHLAERHPARDAAEPAAPRHDTRLRAAPAELPVAERALPAHPRRGRRERPRPVGHEAVEQLVGEGQRPDRQHRAQPAAGLAPLALARCLPGDVDLEPAPAERPPEERLDHPHGLDPPGPDRLGGERDEPAVEAEPVGRVGDGEAVSLVEPAPDELGRAEDPDAREADRRDRRRRRDDRGRRSARPRRARR